MTPRLRPLQDHVLVEMMPPQAVTDSGFFIPDKAQEKAQEGIVRRIGCWRQAKKSRTLIPFDFKVGDKVIIDRRSWGPKLDKAFGPRFRLVKSYQILAVIRQD